MPCATQFVGEVVALEPLVQSARLVAAVEIVAAGLDDHVGPATPGVACDAPPATLTIATSAAVVRSALLPGEFAS